MNKEKLGESFYKGTITDETLAKANAILVIKCANLEQQAKKQKEVIDKLSKIIFEIKDSIEITGGYPSNYIDDLLKILEDKEVSE